MCQVQRPVCVDSGTNARVSTSKPGIACDETEKLHAALRLFETQAMNFGTRFIQDASVRARYFKEVRRMSEDILGRVGSGKLTAAEAAQEANLLRNQIMEVSRLKSSDIGRAAAERLKSAGKSLAELEEFYAQKQFGHTFSRLTAAERRTVHLAIVESAGRARTSVTARAVRMGRLGRAFVVLSLSLAVYNVTTAENKAEAVGREAAALGGGILGGAAAGAATGLVCGPGAPVCSTVLVFVGGALGALGMDFTFSWINGE